ncbi:MAG: carboxypeptidase-like regulatory domain-containing protein, partial [Desulfobacteraceae bacterium]|nr:carboxypeptidase-like regulatory domain-containing protein [Desulfobacteraceae bacterium]
AAISGATVSDGTNLVSTDTNGAYTLNEPAGNYTLNVSSGGYLTTYQITTVTSSGTSTVNWALTNAYGSQPVPASGMAYTILAWNDLGMHCDQDDYSYFCVLPPFNTLHVQVIRRSDDASLIMSGITVSYTFPKKTNSTLHTNFWTYAAQYGWNVPPNIGITGTPLAGNMAPDANNLSWVATGIPITPYDDDGTWDPYGTAAITVKDGSGNVLQTANVVAPVSTEMMCSNCHGTTNPQLDILQKHDAYNGTTLAADQANGIVHACSECHSDNALGAPGQAGVESLSLAMHNFHKDKMTYTSAAANTTPDCYNCHPGAKTQCLRGIMSRAGKSCHDCHGDMYGMTNSILSGRQPWLQEPKCGNCHDAVHQENTNTLYRNSVLQDAPEGDMDNKLYCEACHNSTHAELTTANPADPTIPQKFQGDNYWIWNCSVCHTGTKSGSMHRQGGGD